MPNVIKSIANFQHVWYSPSMLLSQKFVIDTPNEPAILALAMGIYVGCTGQFCVSVTTFRGHHQQFWSSQSVDEALSQATTWLELFVGRIVARSRILRRTPVRLVRWTGVPVLVVGNECVVLDEGQVRALCNATAPTIEATLGSIVRQRMVDRPEVLKHWLSQPGLDWSLLALDASHVADQDLDYEPE